MEWREQLKTTSNHIVHDVENDKEREIR